MGEPQRTCDTYSCFLQGYLMKNTLRSDGNNLFSFRKHVPTTKNLCLLVRNSGQLPAFLLPAVVQRLQASEHHTRKSTIKEFMKLVMVQRATALPIVGLGGIAMKVG